jgi:hypothetical protein
MTDLSMAAARRESGGRGKGEKRRKKGGEVAD